MTKINDFRWKMVEYHVKREIDDENHNNTKRKVKWALSVQWARICCSVWNLEYEKYVLRAEQDICRIDECCDCLQYCVFSELHDKCSELCAMYNDEQCAHSLLGAQCSVLKCSHRKYVIHWYQQRILIRILNFVFHMHYYTVFT